MTYKLNKKTGNIVDSDDGQTIATMSDSSTPEQAKALVEAYNASITKHDRRLVTPEQIRSELESTLAYLRTVIESPVQIVYGGGIQILIHPDNDDNRVVVADSTFGTTTVNYTTEGLILDVHKLNDEESEPVFTTCLDSDDLTSDEDTTNKNYISILQHRIEFSLIGPGAPTELDEISIDHIESMIRDEYREGELNVSEEGSDVVHRGWWAITHITK